MSEQEWFKKFMILQARLIRKMFKRSHESDLDTFAIIWIGRNSETFRRYCEKFKDLQKTE